MSKATMRHIRVAAVIAASLMTLSACAPVRVRTECLYLRTPSPAEQEGAAREMEAHPELPNVRIQAHDLDYAMRQNQACWGRVLK